MKTNLLRNDSSHSQRTSPSPSPAKMSDPTRTLLIVDDNRRVRELEAEILCLEGYNVLQAESAAEALRMAASSAIHLLITDFAMPEVNGLELSRRFRAVHPQTPVLMVSGSLPLLRDESQDLDCIELLAKPFTFNDLVHKVRMLLNAALALPQRKPSCCD